MNEDKELYDFFSKSEKQFQPGLSIDSVIFGFHENQLKVLLTKLKRMELWALAGGFVLKNEHLDDAAVRILRERTGLSDIFLNQFYVFGEPNRSDKKFHIKRMQHVGWPVTKDYWLLQRFITIGYYALVNFSNVEPTRDYISDICDWYDIHDLPPMIIDHGKILDKALEVLRTQLKYQPIGYNLLPQKFTMPELQKLYETILDIQLDRRNFQRKMLGYGILKRLEKRREGGAHKAPYLYSFDLKKYHKALKDGLHGAW
ncbi:MAG TPA: NUDIX domain-containing protein [Puia sp.]|nr:NUDIX domain-containing protein [Puia sp.]